MARLKLSKSDARRIVEAGTETKTSTRQTVKKPIRGRKIEKELEITAGTGISVETNDGDVTVSNTGVTLAQTSDGYSAPRVGISGTLYFDKDWFTFDIIPSESAVGNPYMVTIKETAIPSYEMKPGNTQLSNTGIFNRTTVNNLTTFTFEGLPVFKNNNIFLNVKINKIKLFDDSIGGSYNPSNYYLYFMSVESGTLNFQRAFFNTIRVVTNCSLDSDGKLVLEYGTALAPF